MVKSRIILRNISSVVASKTVVIECPCGPRYHQVNLQHGYSAGTNTLAAAATNISEIRVKVNGRVQRTMSGTQLRDLNLLNGTTYDASAISTTGIELPNTAPGVLFPIFLAEPWRQSPADMDSLAWPTAGWDSFQVEVDLGAASTPTLVASAITDELQPKDKTQPGIVKWIRQSYGASGTSFDVTSLDRRDWYQQITIYPDSGGSNAVTKATLRVNGQILHELSNTANRMLLYTNGMAPIATGRTAGIYDVVLDHDGLLGSAVNMNGARDMQLTIEAGSAMSGTSAIIIQRLGPPE